MLDKKYDPKVKEIKWLNYWQDENIYKFNKNNQGVVYSIDTPPPTVNANIHIGHIFSYSQTEMMARYKRLRGYNVFYPFGFDDNGLPSERLVEREQGKKAHEIGREAFSKLCYETTDKYEAEFEKLFKRVGVSADWSLTYKTVSPETIKISQRSFLELVKSGHCYHKESPALWCNECLTSIAQAELETKTIKTTFNYVNFTCKETNETFTIATTRPELLPAIVCVFVNPNDDKHKHLIGKTAHIPVINIDVPILKDEKVAIDKGTGVVMCCTFGDQTDIEWWRKYKLPLKDIFTKDGKIKDSVSNYGGLKIKEARAKIIEDLKNEGAIVKIEDLEHEVQTHERCGTEVEYSIIPQWFIDIMNHKDDFIKIGNEISWYPKYMHVRYDEWVNTIQWDWCISRQRYFGVPFPLWYCKKCGEVIFANENELPVNPLVDSPKVSKCPKCGHEEFEPEKDVMDTWATSSVTPLINMRYGEKEEGDKKNYEDILKPMTLRMNAHDIIRTWDFYTIVKSFYHFGIRPWDVVAISGYGLNESGEKISKRKENAQITPWQVLENNSADIFRYWSANSKLGQDSFFSEQVMAMGRKLITKIFNVSKFIEIHLKDYEDKECKNFEYIDKWILDKFSQMEKGFIKYFDEYEMGLSLSTLEKFFWNFCDNYIEIVKHRLYRPEEFGEEARFSGQKTVFTILYKLIQDFSIFFPFIAEEIYQEIFKGKYKEEKSIHLTKITPLEFDFSNDIKEGDEIINIISLVRNKKTTSNVALKTEVEYLEISAKKDVVNAINTAKKDFMAMLYVKELKVNEEDCESRIDKIILKEE